MSRAYDIVVAAVLVIISNVIHLIAVELFAPNQPLYEVATDGTQNVNGAARAALWFEILSVWVPLSVVFCAFAWMMIREYRRRVQTTAARAP